MVEKTSQRATHSPYLFKMNDVKKRREKDRKEGFYSEGNETAGEKKELKKEEKISSH